jgi:hypothetical protein
MWLIAAVGNPAGMVANAGAGLGLRDTGLNAAPALGAVLPIFWDTETSWPAALKRAKARDPGNGRESKHSGRFVNNSKLHV